MDKYPSFPALWVDNSILYTISEGPQWDWVPVAHNSNLLTVVPFLGFPPSLCDLPIPLLVFPMIISQINHFHPNLCLRVCVWGTQSKTNTVLVLSLPLKKLHWLLSIHPVGSKFCSSVLDAICNWPLSFVPNMPPPHS